MIPLLGVSALAGYGDAGLGFPTVRGRQMVLWINAARIEPLAFESEYLAGGCSFYAFPPADQLPRAPYRWHDGLADVALEHSLDMQATGLFQHDSSDGTAWSTRVWGAYSGGAIAENIAVGYLDADRTVLRSWMCSTGHRASIMSGLYEDVGADMAGDYATADFGDGAGGVFPPVRIGAHEPTIPLSTVDLYADWVDAAAPDTFDVVLDGRAEPLSLLYGTDVQGVYGTTESPDASDCHAYWFRAEEGGVETRFPETGSYSFGSCAGAGVDTGWLDVQVGPTSYTQGAALWPAGSPVTLTVEGAVPGELVRFYGANQLGTSCPPVLGGACLGVRVNLRLLGSVTADAAGSAALAYVVPALPPGTRIRHQAAVADGLGNWFATTVRTGTVQ